MSFRILSSAILVVSLFASACPASGEEKKCILFDQSYGQRLGASNADAVVWWASSGWKVDRNRPAPSKSGKAVSIRLAKNETEAAQLIVRPNKPLAGFLASPSALQGPGGATIGAECVEVLRVRYVHVVQQTDASSAPGWWPDPLPPFKGAIALAANENQPLWIRVHVPKDTPAGDYRGTIALRADGYSAEAPLWVHVYDFELPDRMTCSTAFGFDAGGVYRYQDLNTPEQRNEVIAKYWASLSAHHISPYHFTPGVEPKVTWVKLEDRESADLPEAERELARTYAVTPEFDWTAWDAEMQRMFDTYRFDSFRLGIPGMGGSEVNGLGRGTPERALAFKNYCHAMQEHLRERGWLDKAYVYWFDEPTEKDYPHVMAGFAELKSAAPDIRRMLTEQPEPTLMGGPNLWCPLTLNYKHEKTLPCREQGDHFWWYVCTIPKRPYCGLFIDHPATDLRVWLWQTWKYSIEGILIWQSNLWTTGAAYPEEPQNPYEDTMSWDHGHGIQKGEKRPWGNGDGRFMYPPEAAANAHPAQPVLDGPVDSIRWEMLRDGIEDYEYLVLLKHAINSKGGHAARRYEKLLQVPETITKDLRTYTKDPAPVEKRRDAIAHAIERLNH